MEKYPSKEGDLQGRVPCSGTGDLGRSHGGGRRVGVSTPIHVRCSDRGAPAEAQHGRDLFLVHPLSDRRFDMQPTLQWLRALSSPEPLLLLTPPGEAVAA